MGLSIEVRDLTKRFPGPRTFPWSPPGRDSIALSGVTFDVRPGEIFSLIGPNGAGKTTLLKILSTLLLPTSGVARIGGADVVREESQVRSRISLVTNSERSFYYRLSGWENLRFFCGLYNMAGRDLRERMQPLAETLGLTEAVLARDYRTYSTGTQRKLQFLRAFVLNTPVLFLDEPTSSLDPVSAEEIRRVIATECRARHQTVVLSANNLVDVERLADRVAMIHRGRLEVLGAPPAGSGAPPIRLFVRAPMATVLTALEEFARGAHPADPVRWEIDERAGGVAVRCWTRGPRESLPGLLECLWQAGVLVEQVDLRPFVLEEEFLRRVDEAGPEPEEVPG
ncbi:MAG: ABC transporter ATP-binding protein [Thermoplasmata archaeon]